MNIFIHFFADGSTVDIVFNVVEITAGQGRKFSRPGICTGWLQQLTSAVANEEFPKVRKKNYFWNYQKKFNANLPLWVGSSFSTLDVHGISCTSKHSIKTCRCEFYIVWKFTNNLFGMSYIESLLNLICILSMKHLSSRHSNLRVGARVHQNIIGLGGPCWYTFLLISIYSIKRCTKKGYLPLHPNKNKKVV